MNIYSARHYDTDLALYDRFTELTGIRVNLIEGGSDALIARIANEGKYSPADILITVDAGRLWRAKEKGVFQAVDSAILAERVPSYLRDQDNYWFGLSKRARIIVYNKKTGIPSSVKSYEDLVSDSLRGRICMRSSSNIYNLSLMAAMIESHGVDGAEQWAKGVVANFARKPQGNDTSNLRSVAAGECGITLANTYYLGRFLATDEPKSRTMFDSLGILFPNQDGRGTHVNISGAGVTKHAPNRENAIKFLEYLSSDFAQALFAEGNNEYPVVGEASGPIRKLGSFIEDNLNSSLLGANQAAAVRAYDKAGWQ
ncbi:MAG: Fe(3+) ABC transporter substrate-binding protein [Pseudomonadota bacterium]